MKKLKTWNLSFLVTVFALLMISNCKKEDKPSFVHEYGSFTDTRDGHTYKTIEIGSQTWFAGNLAYEGAGKEITDFLEWANDTTYNAWCYYDNDKATYESTYGILYQWGVATIACPAGWHLPNRTEWQSLRDYLGGEYEAGGKLKEAGTTHWLSPNKGATNESGFAALPGGSRQVVQPSSFNAIGDYGFFWGSDSDSAFAMNASMASWSDSFWISEQNLSHKNSGFSVRCLKD